MSIACEIDRLQCAKADICTAIENKGVTVGNITLDDYACCIDAIQSGGGGSYVDFLLVGGGGGGGHNDHSWSGSTSCGGGGGAGGIVICYNYLVSGENCVIVGAGGNVNNNGCNSCFGNVVAYGGGYGSRGNFNGGNGGSGGGGNSGGYNTSGGNGCGGVPRLQGCSGGVGGNRAQCGRGGGPNGGAGMTSDIPGYAMCIGIGGCKQDGGTASPYCGNGGKGGYSTSGGVVAVSATAGCPGIAVVRYKTDGSMGINCATGGCVYNCGEYTIHCFTSDGTFTVVS